MKKQTPKKAAKKAAKKTTTSPAMSAKKMPSMPRGEREESLGRDLLVMRDKITELQDAVRLNNEVIETQRTMLEKNHKDLREKEDAHARSIQRLTDEAHISLRRGLSQAHEWLKEYGAPEHALTEFRKKFGFVQPQAPTKEGVSTDRRELALKSLGEVLEKVQDVFRKKMEKTEPCDCYGCRLNRMLAEKFNREYPNLADKIKGN